MQGQDQRYLLCRAKLSKSVSRRSHPVTRLNVLPKHTDGLRAVEYSNKKKTKAKQRYLKIKKERRKKRKVTAAEALHKANVKNKPKISGAVSWEVRQPQHDKTSELEDSSHSADDERTGDIVSSSQSVRAPSLGNKEVDKRLRKWGKVANEAKEAPSSPSSSSCSLPSHATSQDKHNRNSVPRNDSAHVERQPHDLTAFPMPSAPAAASRRELALQGLDPGLVDAEIIDAAQTISIHSPDSHVVDHPSALGLSLKTRRRLTELGIVEFFAVQTALLPFLLPRSPFKRALYMPHNLPRDVCVSAPTGSGKTLAYVLPILELLSTRVVTRLRALIVLPTRDLVIQVRETFEAVCKGRGLKIGTATGQHSFPHEQAQLVDESFIPLQGGSSKVDILICTPGRLIDHLEGTPDFTLQHLRFLVIDEADRLLTQSFQDWLARVLSATRPPSSISSESPSSSSEDKPTSDICPIGPLPYHDALSPAWIPPPPSRSHVDEKREPSCQKLLFSATLTRDPAKISALDLRDAKYFVVKDIPNKATVDGHVFGGETFVFPATLNEHMIVCTSFQKPLILFYLAHRHGITNALVFTKSAESTTRLVRLFECFETAMGTLGGRVACAYSSDLSANERKTILERFKSQDITILVCSDLISRGIDISHVSHVVNYDAPVDMRKYVHRVGRTARAGRRGDAWSLIETQEARYFKSMLADADHLSKVRKMKISEDALKELKAYYEMAMKMYNAKSDAKSDGEGQV